MNKREYLADLEAGLDFIEPEERGDIVRELESHIDEALGLRADLPEEEVVSRLPPPASVAARYRAEVEPESGEGGAAGRPYKPRSGADGSQRTDDGFPFGDPDDFFRYARRKPETIEGAYEGIGNLEIRSVSADIVLTPGTSLRYRIKGSWGPEDEPKLRVEGSRLSVELGRHCRRAEFEVPPTLVEFMATSASGDIMAELPEGAAATLKTASGDARVVSSGGRMTVSSASGDISVEGRPGAVSARTSSGDVVIRSVVDAASVTSDSGDLTIELAEPGADVAAVTLSGDVSIRLAPGSAPSIVAETLSGDVSMPDARVTSSQRRKRFERTGGPAKIEAKTLSGDISIA